jgi:hypothetical protein
MNIAGELGRAELPIRLFGRTESLLLQALMGQRVS